MSAEIIVTLDVMLARRKRRAKDLAAEIGMTEANLSLLKSGKVKGVSFRLLWTAENTSVVPRNSLNNTIPNINNGRQKRKDFVTAIEIPLLKRKSEGENIEM